MLSEIAWGATYWTWRWDDGAEAIQQDSLEDFRVWSDAIGKAEGHFS